MDTSKHFRNNERELIRVANFFKRQSKKLIESGIIGEEHQKVGEAVDRFVEHMNQHVATRVAILEQRKVLQALVKDNAVCPECNTSDKLKLVGTEKNEKGWRSNRYKCRKCNITFTWNRPNNPWDMILFIEDVLGILKLKIEEPSMDEQEREQTRNAIESLETSMSALKGPIEAHNREYSALQEREAEMDKLIHEFKNSLMIEKIRMDQWKGEKEG
jgi:hypothetical protein